MLDTLLRSTFLRGKWISIGMGILLLSGILSVLDPGSGFAKAFPEYLVVCLLGATLLLGAWRAVGDIERPRWLLLAVLVALFLRLGVGVGLHLSLPEWGYADSVPNQSGYIYSDAFNRDLAAWELAASDERLVSVWRDPALADQYGGLLYLSALSYRYLSPDVHRPLLIVLFTATIGAAATLFSWSFTRRAFGDRAAAVAAWAIALYPEAILLSASQMREPFLITAFALMLDGYARRVHQANPHGIYLVALGFITALFISPPFSFLLLGGVSLAWLWEGKGDRKRTGWILGVIAALGLAALALTIRSWAALEGRPGGNVVELVGWWLTSGAKYQLHVLAQRSGWVQKMFELAPEWSHMPLATLYGLVQPFLPAAVMDSTSLPLIRTVVSLRGLGWFVFLPFLMYAPFASLRQEGWRSLPAYLTLFVWGGAVLVSYRDAGQQWDNPRWRAVFLCAQVAMVGWAWVAARQSGSPWLGRVSVLVVFATLAFVHWEAGRYYQTPRLNLWKTLSLIGAFSILFLAASIVFDRYRKTKVRT